tara:strand:- start:2342 stop:2779 length:438 start_codon:yes stop_codon:yes gene_type:complete
MCNDEHYNWGNNPSPLFDSGKCCDKCDILFVIPSRLMGHKDICEQLHFMDEIKDDLPSDVLEHQEKVYDNLFGENQQWNNTPYSSERLEELYDEWIDEKAEELKEITLSQKEVYDTLCKALDNAVENEYFEAAAKIHKRMKELVN